MTTMTISNTNELHLQACGKCCVTAQRQVIIRTILFIIVLAVCIAAVVFSYIRFQPTALTHPDFETAAIAGRPSVAEEHGYSTLTVKDGYEIMLCGSPEIRDNEVFLNITNPRSNDVWFRAEILNSAGDTIGSTGVLKQGQYLPSVQLTEVLTAPETSVSVRIVGYAPNSWQSAGNVTLKMELTANG